VTIAPAGYSPSSDASSCSLRTLSGGNRAYRFSLNEYTPNDPALAAAHVELYGLRDQRYAHTDQEEASGRGAEMRFTKEEGGDGEKLVEAAWIETYTPFPIAIETALELIGVQRDRFRKEAAALLAEPGTAVVVDEGRGPS
jgi:hypothetical protein